MQNKELQENLAELKANQAVPLPGEEEKAEKPEKDEKPEKAEKTEEPAKKRRRVLIGFPRIVTGVRGYFFGVFHSRRSNERKAHKKRTGKVGHARRKSSGGVCGKHQ